MECSWEFGIGLESLCLCEACGKSSFIQTLSLVLTAKFRVIYYSGVGNILRSNGRVS